MKKIRNLFIYFLLLFPSLSFGARISGGLNSISTNTSGAGNFIWNTNTLQSGSTFYVQEGNVKSTMTIFGVLDIKDPNYQGSRFLFPADFYTYPGEFNDQYMHFFSYDYTGANPVGIKMGECFDESCIDTLGVIKKYEGFSVNVGTFGATNPSDHPRIEVFRNYSGNNYAQIWFNRLNKGFTLQESSITFEAGAIDPILDWSESGKLKFINSVIQVSTITHAGSTVYVDQNLTATGTISAQYIYADDYIITPQWYIYSASKSDFSGFSREEDATGRVILSDGGGGFYTDSPIATGDSGYFYAGNDADLQIANDGLNGYINNLTGSLSTRNTNTSPITGGKLIYSSSFTNVSTTGNMYGILTNSYISGGASNPGSSPVYITSYEDLDLVLSTTFNTSFNSYVGKKFDITMTGIPGTGNAGLGTSAYGVQYSVNATGSFNGSLVTLLSPIYNSVTLTNVTAGGSGFTSLIENQMSLSGTCSIAQLHGISLTMNMGSGSTMTTLRGIYLSMSAGTTIAINESYGIYSYNTTGGSGYFSYPTFYNLYLRSGYGSTMNGIGVYTEIENDGCGSWSFLTAKGDSIIRELYVGLPYRGTVGVTGGDLKANIVTNYDFASDTDWTKGTGWTITGGNAVKAAGTASNLTPTSPLVPKVGRVYYVQMAWATYTAGNLSIQFGGQTYNVLKKGNNQQVYFHMKAVSTGTLTLIADASANYSINYIFIREVGDSNLYMAEGKLNFWDANNYIRSTSTGMIDIAVSSGVRIGTYTANYTMFTSSGYQTMVGDARPWDDLRIEPVARTTGANAPTFEVWATTNGWRASTGSRGIWLYTFDDSSSEKEVMFTMQMPHDWNQEGILLHVHWVGRVDDTTAAPRWGLDYAWKELGTTYSTSTLVYSDGVNYTSAGTSVNVSSGTHYISKFVTLSPSADQDGLSSILIGRIFRNSSDAADTYNAANADCGLLYIDAHYRRNKIGSYTEY